MTRGDYLTVRTSWVTLALGKDSSNRGQRTPLVKAGVVIRGASRSTTAPEERGQMWDERRSLEQGKELEEDSQDNEAAQSRRTPPDEEKKQESGHITTGQGQQASAEEDHTEEE